MATVVRISSSTIPLPAKYWYEVREREGRGDKRKGKTKIKKEGAIYLMFLIGLYCLLRYFPQQVYYVVVFHVYNRYCLFFSLIILANKMHRMGWIWMGVLGC